MSDKLLILTGFQNHDVLHSINSSKTLLKQYYQCVTLRQSISVLSLIERIIV